MSPVRPASGIGSTVRDKSLTESMFTFLNGLAEVELIFGRRVKQLRSANQINNRRRAGILDLGPCKRRRARRVARRSDASDAARDPKAQHAFLGRLFENSVRAGCRSAVLERRDRDLLIGSAVLEQPHLAHAARVRWLPRGLTAEFSHFARAWHRLRLRVVSWLGASL